ncbi:MAG: ATP-binding protein, partial [Candidatus Hodarchaeota archaeon]
FLLSAIAAEEEIDFAALGIKACIAKGPINIMAKHILAVLKQLDMKSSDAFSGEILGLESIYKRQITKELLSNKKHFEVILGSMSEGILETTPDGRTVYANSSALSLIGIPEENLLGVNFIELFEGNDRQRIKDALKMMGTLSQSISEDIPLKLNGKKVTFNIIPISDNGYRRTNIIILNDVTERERMEAQLLMAQKIEAIATLAGGVAHDFNNLLMGILGNASLLLLDINGAHPHYEKLTSIEKLVKSGSKLTSQLLGYARKGKYEVKPINLNQLVGESSETFGRTRKEITIHRELAENLFAIEADQGQIEQVLFNLYVNAADAMPRGGNLILKTMNNTHKEMKGKLYAPKPGNYVVLTVTDTGTGMDKETLKRIFDPFFTTKEMGRGTGLGLASVYGIIKGHGGYIDVDSEKMKGTTFRIYLPATEKEVQKISKPYEPIKKGTETILLVDDEEIILNVGRELLDALGYRVLLARSGKEAIDIINKAQRGKEKEEKRKGRPKKGSLPFAPDLVILDMVMPDMKGGEAYDRLKKINSGIKVLLSSGYNINGEASSILKRGCDGFIQKPFSMKQLSESIRSILDEK